MQTLESENAQNKIEIDHLRDLVANAKDRSERDKEALKKATRYTTIRILFFQIFFFYKVDHIKLKCCSHDLFYCFFFKNSANIFLSFF